MVIRGVWQYPSYRECSAPLLEVWAVQETQNANVGLNSAVAATAFITSIQSETHLL